MGKITPFSNIVEDVLFGSLLGDGCITLNKGYANPRFSFRHSYKQKDYFYWKAGLLRSISSEKSTWKQKGKTSDLSGTSSIKLRYQSKASPDLLKLYKLATKNNKKFIRRKLLNLLTPRSLAIWWMDDGSIISNGRKGVLCTDSFSLKEVSIIQKYLKTVWDLGTKLSYSSSTNVGGKRYIRLYIRSTEELKKFLRIVLPYVEVKEMLYKFIILYKDEGFQQRWISEMSNLTGYNTALLTDIVSKRKMSLKAFN